MFRVSIYCFAAAFLLTACQPISPQLLPTPTPSPIAPADAPTPPQTGVHFPVSSAVLPPVAVQPPAPAAPAHMPTATPTPELLNGPVTVAVDAAVPEEWAGPLLSVLNKTADVQTFSGVQPLRVLDQTRNAAVQVALRPLVRPRRLWQSAFSPWLRPSPLCAMMSPSPNCNSAGVSRAQAVRCSCMSKLHRSWAPSWGKLPI